MQKRMLLISQVFYPDQVSTASLFTSLCVELVGKGVEIKVWCAQPSYDKRIRQKSQIVYNGVNIRYLASTNFPKNRLLGRAFNYSTFTLAVFFRLLFCAPKYPVFTSTNPPFLGILVLLLGRLKRLEITYIIQDVYPDGLIRLKMLRPNGVVARIWRSLNKLALASSKNIVVIGRDMVQWVKKVHPDSFAKIVYIPIWQDGSLVQPMPFKSNLFVLRHNLSNKFVIQYSGNMGLWNDMKSIAKVINRLKDESILFTFIGEGIRKRELVEDLEDSSMKLVRFFPYQDKKELAYSLTACHVAIVSQAAGLSGIAVPSKIMGILAAGVAVLAIVPDSCEVAQIVREHNCGIQVHPENMEGVLKAIQFFMNNPVQRQLMGQNGYTAFMQHYSTQSVVNSYMNLV